MRSIFAALRSLVLPYGRTSGQRIVLDGVNGTITVFDTNDVGVVQLRAGDAAIVFRSPTGTVDLGFLDEFLFGTQRGMRLAPPTEDAADDQAMFFVVNEDASGADEAAFVYRVDDGVTPHDVFQITGGAAPTLRFRDKVASVLQVDGGTSADMWFDHPSTSVPRISIGRGLVDSTGQIDVPEGPYTGDTNSADFVLTNVPVVAGRQYDFWLNGLAELSAAGSWQANLLLNGSYIGTFTRITSSGLERHPLAGFVSWIAPTTQATDDFVVHFDERTGAADLTVIGGLTATDPPRIFSVYDVGVP